MTTTTGKVRKHLRGFGFLIPDDPKALENIYIEADSLEQVLEGDRVKVQIQKGRSKLGPRSRVIEVLHRSQTHCIGRLAKEEGTWWVKRSDEDPDPPLKVEGQPQGRAGDLVLAKITQYPTRKSPLTGIIEKSLKGSEAEMDILRECVQKGWPFEFSKETQAEMKTMNLSKELPTWRKDCRHLPLITIDGEDAKDFDDAVAAIQNPNGSYSVYVAIADVSHYVTPGTQVDTEAFTRATSVYFPGRAVPMLPEHLSNELCSLKPHIDRDVLMCEMHFSKDGIRREFEFYPARMHSQRRCTYSEVQTYFDSGDLKGASSEVTQSLKILKHLYLKLLHERRKRGALDFDLPESRIYVDAQGFPTQIISQTRYESHKLIEEWMIAANRCAAELIDSKFDKGVYRNHAHPTTKKLELFIALAKRNFPKNIPSIKAIQKSSKELQNFLDGLAGTPKQELFHMMALRSLAIALYESVEQGHYGLALSHYTHFTSPIRRYPDLMVHRLIKKILKVPQKTDKNPIAPAHMSLEYANSHSSNQERLAMELERKVSDIKKCRFIEPRIGEKMESRIVGVGEMGIFVRLLECPIEGLILIETLPRDQYRVDDAHQEILGRNPQHRYHLGDQIQVKCCRVNIPAGRITFELAHDSSRSR